MVVACCCLVIQLVISTSGSVDLFPALQDLLRGKRTTVTWMAGHVSWTAKGPSWWPKAAGGKASKASKASEASEASSTTPYDWRLCLLFDTFKAFIWHPNSKSPSSSYDLINGYQWNMEFSKSITARRSPKIYQWNLNLDGIILLVDLKHRDSTKSLKSQSRVAARWFHVFRLWVMAGPRCCQATGAMATSQEQTTPKIEMSSA